jgi:hypothetical protein
MKLKIVLLLLLQCFITRIFAQSDPLDFQATPSEDAYQIVLTWTNTSTSVNGFVIQKEWDDYYWNSIEIVIPPNTTSYIDTSVEPNKPYYYSIEGASIAVTLFRQPPPVPANVTAVTGVGTSMSIDVSFTDNSDMETWYEVQNTSYLPDFTGDPANFFGIETMTGGTLGSVLTMSGLVIKGPYDSWYYYPPNSTVYVRIRAVIKDGSHRIYSDFSPVISAVTQSEPSKPINFLAEGGEDDKIHLSWTENSDHEAAFLFSRTIDGSNDYERVILLPENTNSYIDSDVAPNVRYHYKLIAIDLGEFKSDRPDLLWPYLIGDPRHVDTYGMLFKLPPAPTQVNAEATGSTSIFINFSDDSDLEMWYDIEIAQAYDGPYSHVEYYDYLSTEVYDLQPNTTYYFRVRGVLEIGNESFYGEFSTPVSATTFPDIAAPIPPVAKLATFVSPTQFTANWSAVEGADHYVLDVIARKDSTFLTGCNGKIVTDTTLVVTGTNASRSYSYVVRAVNENGTSENSNTIIVARNKGITLRTVCSDNPSIFRRWKIINNNPFAINVKWRVPNTSQIGTLTAMPGETFFFTQTVPGINYALITWLDDNLHQGSSIKSSTWKSCAEVLARDGNVNDDQEEDASPFDIVLFPVPISETFNIMIHTPDDSEVDLEITNLQGQQLFSIKTPGNTSHEIDAQAFAPGLYFLKARQHNDVKVLKVLKK